MADNYTVYANMQVVPSKFSQYTLDRTTALSMLVRSGIATSDATVAQLINGTPQGGRFITLPHYNALGGDDDVFSETALEVSNVTTDAANATLLMRQKAWGATDLAHVLGGSDPMAAIANLVSDWWLEKEQAIYLSILKGVLDPTSGALKGHCNNISGETGTAANISVGAALDTKQALGDHYNSLGVVFMHSATYTQLQKNQDIATEYDATLQIKIETYLGYRVIVDDGLPYYSWTKDTTNGTVTITDANLAQYQAHCLETLAKDDKVKAIANPIYDTYFVGQGCFIRQDGTPQGFVGTETDRDKLAAKDVLINRRCMVIHPRGLSWNVSATYPSGIYYPTNAMLATPGNWALKTDHKKCAMAMLRHKLNQTT
mgnify:FL=1